MSPSGGISPTTSGRGASGPGVLVMPEAFGVGAHARDRVDRLARARLRGHGGRSVRRRPRAERLAGGDQRTRRALLGDPTRARQRARVALDRLASVPKVDGTRLAAIGFCMGGTLSLELARDGAPLAGITSFHGGLQTSRPAEPGKIGAKILVCTGADDPLRPGGPRQRARGGDDRCQRGLADHHVRRHPAQLHQPSRRPRRRAGDLVQQVRRRAVLERDARAVRGGVLRGGIAGRGVGRWAGRPRNTLLRWTGFGAASGPRHDTSRFDIPAEDTVPGPARPPPRPALRSAASLRRSVEHPFGMSKLPAAGRLLPLPFGERVG